MRGHRGGEQRPALRRRARQLVPHVLGGDEEGEGGDDGAVVDLLLEAPVAAVHPVHLEGPERGAARTLLPSAALGLAEGLGQLRTVGRRDFVPGLLVEDAAVLADEDGGGAVVVDVTVFAVEFAEFAGEAAEDLLRGLRSVKVGEGVVFVGVDDDGVAHLAVLPLDVGDSGTEIPAVAEVDGEGVVDGVDGADDGVVPFVHTRRGRLGFVAELEADHAVHARDLLRHEDVASLGEGQVGCVAPEVGPSAAGAAVDLPVGTARDGMEVDQDTDAVIEAALDESLHR